MNTPAQRDAEIRAQVANEIADELAKIARDEAQRPNRDVVSRAIETWMHTAAEIARTHAQAPSGPQPVTRHASPGCACGINDAGRRFVDPICARKSQQVTS